MSDAWLDVVYLAGAVAAIGGYYMYRQKANAADSAISNWSKMNATKAGAGKASASQGKSASSSAGGKADSRRPMTILFGSQTGTADEFAHRVGEAAKFYGFRARVRDMEDFEPSDLGEEELVILLAATYGEGEPTDNAIDFFNYLEDEYHGSDLLAGVKYAVFGLGNKTYKSFNYMGRQMDKRMEALGATRVARYGEGDDDGNMEEDFVRWETQLWTDLCEAFEIDQASLGNLDDQPIEYAYRIVYHPERQLSEVEARKQCILGCRTLSKKPVYVGKVSVNEELNNMDVSERSTRHVELDISGLHLSYDAGDHLAVYPCMPAPLVERVAARVGIDDLDAVFTFVADDKELARNSKVVFPSPCTLRQALTHFLDLLGPPPARFLKAMAEFASDPAEADRLRLLSSSKEDGRKAYNEYIKKGERTVIEVLEDFSSVAPPLEHFLEAMALLHPRYFSIASTCKTSPKAIALTVAVVDWQTPSARHARGAASGYLADQALGTSVMFSLRRSTFHVPLKVSVPIIMIGPGTGIAPFRGFIQERMALAAENPKTGKCLLYFGCRRKNEDYVYKDLLAKAEASGVLDLRVAFSREQKEKVYVQHLVAEDADKVWDLIENQGAFLYVCGDASHMARDVKAALAKIVGDKLGQSVDDAEAYLDAMQKKGRYLLDVW